MCKIVYTAPGAAPPECDTCYALGHRRSDILPGIFNAPLTVEGRVMMGTRFAWANLCESHMVLCGQHTSVTERRVSLAPAGG